MRAIIMVFSSLSSQRSPDTIGNGSLSIDLDSGDLGSENSVLDLEIGLRSTQDFWFSGSNEPYRLQIKLTPEDDPNLGNKFVVCVLGSGGASREIKGHADTQKAQECFNRIKEETFKHLSNKFDVNNNEKSSFKLFIMKNLTGVWECNGKSGTIDYADMSQLTEGDQQNIARDFAEFQRMFHDEAPVGKHSSAPIYQSGYMGDITEPSGFLPNSMAPRSPLSTSMGDFLEKHFEKAIGSGKTVEQYYNAMRDMAIMDLYRKKTKKVVKQELQKLEEQLTTIRYVQEEKEKVRKLEFQKGRLETIFEGLQYADQFAVNFARCIHHADSSQDRMNHDQKIAQAHNLANRANSHLLDLANRGRWFFQRKDQKLAKENQNYADLIGTLALNNRVNEFIPYCKQRDIYQANTAIEHNFLVGNLERCIAKSNDSSELESLSGSESSESEVPSNTSDLSTVQENIGMEIFDGISDISDLSTVQENIGMEIFDGINNEIIENIKVAMKEASEEGKKICDKVKERIDRFTGNTTPKDAIADFKKNEIYPDGWEPAKSWFGFGP
jgi:hypothetical protein